MVDGPDVEGAKRLLREVVKLLKTPMPTVGPTLIQHLAELDAWLFTCLAAAAEMRGWYRAGKSNKVRVVADVLDGACEAIKRRTSLGQTILNYHMAEINAQMRR